MGSGEGRVERDQWKDQQRKNSSKKSRELASGRTQRSRVSSRIMEARVLKKDSRDCLKQLMRIGSVASSICLSITPRLRTVRIRVSQLRSPPQPSSSSRVRGYHGT